MKTQKNMVAHGGVPHRGRTGTTLELPRGPCCHHHPVLSPEVTAADAPPETCMGVQACLSGPISLVVWDSSDRLTRVVGWALAQKGAPGLMGAVQLGMALGFFISSFLFTVRSIALDDLQALSTWVTRSQTCKFCPHGEGQVLWSTDLDN